MGLEFDHIEEVARGGEATVPGIRLLCRAHNQYMAERTFGAEFMRHKRLAASERRAVATARATAEHSAAERDRELDVVPRLKALGFSASQARSAAAACEDMPDATLEERVKAALSHFRPRGTRTLRPAPAGTSDAPAVAAAYGGD